MRPLTILRRFVPSFAVFLAGFLLSSPAASGAPGDLDPSFGTGGKVTTRLENLGQGDDRAYPNHIAVQPDGKIVVAGKASTNYKDDFAVVRYNADGSLDQTFGSGGVVRTDFFGLSDEAGGVVIQPDGKIVVGGHTVIRFNNSEADSAFALARYNPDGSLDPTFGSGGKVVTNYLPSYDHGNHLLLQPDGKIVLSGFVTQGSVNSGSTYDFAVARYNTDGSLDSTFGTGGIATTDFAGRGDRVYWSVLQPDGRIVVAGVAFSEATGSDFALARYNTNGTLDLTFNGTGKVTTNFAGNFEDFGRSVALAPDGKIVVAGWARNNTTLTGRADYALARYNEDGTLDTSFNGTGRWTHDVSGENESDYARGVAVQQNGKIIVVGTGPLVRVTGGSHVDWGVLRLNPNGTFDNSWGNGGKVFTDFREFYPGHLSGESADAVLLQPDGRVIVAGTATFERYTFDFAVARYFGDPVAPAPVLTKAVSRMMHDGAAFDIDLPLNGRGVECRAGSGAHQVVFTFNSPVTVGGATIEGAGQVASVATSGSQVLVDLAGLANAGTVAVRLNSVSNGSSSTNVSVRMGVLAGDTNGNGQVNASDVSQAKSQSGQPLNATNFRSDVNMNGTTNSTDIGIVRAASGSSLEE